MAFTARLRNMLTAFLTARQDRVTKESEHDVALSQFHAKRAALEQAKLDEEAMRKALLDEIEAEDKAP